MEELGLGSDTATGGKDVDIDVNVNTGDVIIAGPPGPHVQPYPSAGFMHDPLPGTNIPTVEDAAMPIVTFGVTDEQKAAAGYNLQPLFQPDLNGPKHLSSLKNRLNPREFEQDLVNYIVDKMEGQETALHGLLDFRLLRGIVKRLYRLVVAERERRQVEKRRAARKAA